MGTILFRVIVVGALISIALYGRSLYRRVKDLSEVRLTPSDFGYDDEQDDRPTHPDEPPTLPVNEVPLPEPVVLIIGSRTTYQHEHADEIIRARGLSMRCSGSA